MKKLGTICAVCIVAILAGLVADKSSLLGEESPAQTLEVLRAAIKKLAPLQTKLAKPGLNDWLACHKEEGQSFDQYLEAKPVNAWGKRNVIYIQKLGKPPEAQGKVLALAMDFIARFYSLEVKQLPSLPPSGIPESMRRDSRGYGEQFNSIYILDEILKPKLPEDAAALVAFSANDLYPEDSWNFVFGQASLRNRVGVWSIIRFGEPSEGEAQFKQCLLRTIKLASHEIGHMFTLSHCIAQECGMCGSNNLEESDLHPLAFCNECMAKVCHATKADPIARYAKLEEFCRSQGLKEEADFYQKCIKALK